VILNYCRDFRLYVTETPTIIQNHSVCSWVPLYDDLLDRNMYLVEHNIKTVNISFNHYLFYWPPSTYFKLVVNLTDFIKALPGNSSVNTVQHTTIDEVVFSMSSGPSSGGTTGLCDLFLSNGSVNTLPPKQWRQQQRRCFPWGLYRVLIREVNAVTESVQGQLRVSRESRKIFGCEVPEWLKTKLQEDFIVIWSASLCVEIRCQETTSEDGES
jgi:hypothetical protein